MTAELFARIQFYLTVGFHFIFAPLTIGLAWVNVYFMYKYLKSKDQYYKDASWFWNKIFLLGVVLGIPSGVVMEFQFGTNWAEYSRYVGEVFGPALAMEVVFAFFMESVFLGILFVGWNSEKISKNVLFLASVMVAIGSTISAFFILSANSWMHTPAGYRVENGKIVLDDMITALFNPSVGLRLLHTVGSCLLLAGFVVVAISSWYLLKNEHLRFAKESFSLGLVIILVTAILQAVIGHFHTIQVAATQPAKFAAYEALFETSDNASMMLIGLVTDSGVISAIAIPGFLSFALHGVFGRTVQGLDAFTPDIPSVILTFYSYHFMVYIGAYFIIFAIAGLFLKWKKNLLEKDSTSRKWFLRISILSVPLPWIAIQLGWIATEVGRQPWVVQGLMYTRNAISSTSVVDAGQVLFTLIVFILVYLLLFVVWLALTLRIIKHGPKFVTTEKQEAEA
ncbi:MAG: cytochrome ubiquinol oxidase subunit I [Candidatus Thorarchaeota archaeon]